MGDKKIIPNQTESKSYSLKFIGTTFQRWIVFIAKKSTPAENQPGEQGCACTFEKKNTYPLLLALCPTSLHGDEQQHKEILSPYP